MPIVKSTWDLSECLSLASSKYQCKIYPTCPALLNSVRVMRSLSTHYARYPVFVVVGHLMQTQPDVITGTIVTQNYKQFEAQSVHIVVMKALPVLEQRVFKWIIRNLVPHLRLIYIRSETQIIVVNSPEQAEISPASWLFNFNLSSSVILNIGFGKPFTWDRKIYVEPRRTVQRQLSLDYILTIF